MDIKTDTELILLMQCIMMAYYMSVDVNDGRLQRNYFLRDAGKDRLNITRQWCLDRLYSTKIFLHNLTTPPLEFIS